MGPNSPARPDRPREKWRSVDGAGIFPASDGEKEEDRSVLTLKIRSQVDKQTQTTRKSLCVTFKYDPRRIQLASPKNENYSPTSRSVCGVLDTITLAAILSRLPSMSTEGLITLKHKIESLLEESVVEADTRADDTEDWYVLADDHASETQYDFVEDAGIVKQYEN